MSLTTGERLNRRSWTELPMENIVISAIEAIFLSNGQPALGRDGPLFEWRPGILLNNEELTVAQDPPLNENIYDYKL